MHKKTLVCFVLAALCSAFETTHERHNEEAAALIRKAQATSDDSYYAKAEEALKKSFAIQPDNFNGRKLLATILIGRQEFEKGLELATKLNKSVPDDVDLYGLLTDAHLALGNYKEAEAACQWMLDLRPANPGALIRAARFREMFGNWNGATEALKGAYQRILAEDAEERAAVLTYMGRVEAKAGRLDTAEKLLLQAMEILPGYHEGLAELAEVRMAQRRFTDAVNLLRQRNEKAPRAENVFALAEALQRAGQPDEARVQYVEFERKASEGLALVQYQLGAGGKPAEALRVARKIAETRRDYRTLDALAWALYANGEYAGAKKAMDEAMRSEVRDAKVLYHAGAIAAKLNDTEAAERLLTESLSVNAKSEVSREAMGLLGDLK